MKVIKRYKDGSVKIHIEDSDRYECTDDNGVDVWITKEDITKICAIEKNTIPVKVVGVDRAIAKAGLPCPIL